MSNKQLSIPGLELPTELVRKPAKADKITNLETRVLRLELELSPLRILMEKGEPGLK